jgi:hypothetical protein
MTKASSTTQKSSEVTEPFRDAFHTGMGAIEQTVLAAAEIPLSVLASLGVSEEAMESAREGHRQMVRGIHKALDSVAMGITDTAEGIAGGIVNVAGKQAAAVTDVTTKMAKNGSK